MQNNIICYLHVIYYYLAFERYTYNIVYNPTYFCAALFIQQ